MKAFGGYHPAVTFTYFISVLLTAMFVWNPVIQLTALLGGIMFSLMLCSDAHRLRLLRTCDNGDEDSLVRP